MNWDAISAISEAIGAAAVVINLVYLAIQIRYNSAESHENSRVNRLLRANFVFGVHDSLLTIAENPNL